LNSVHHILENSLCRDCLERCPTGASPRCLHCGSPRLIDIDSAQGLRIAHIDCDAFYASIEKRDNPGLREKPVIVGGIGRRAVASTCCYIARTYGVRSAMPMAQAIKLCPQATVIEPDMAKYARVGRQVRDLMQTLTPLVEPLSIDEAFLDLSGCERVNAAGAAETLARFAHRIEREVGVSVSVGLSYCKFVAKFASDLDKPRGFAIVRRDEAMARLGPQNIGRLWGVGRVAQERLEKLGLFLIRDIQALNEEQLQEKLGPEGARLGRLARGEDDRRVSLSREAKSISSETTFDSDVADMGDLTRTLLGLCERVAERLKKQNLAARGFTLKLRTADFKLRTRARMTPEPTQLATRLFAALRPLLETVAPSAPFRLIGVAAADFSRSDSADRGDLADPTIGREKARETAIDALRAKFGRQAVQRGIAFAKSDAAKPH
jgi:DNA polymerase IV